MVKVCEWIIGRRKITVDIWWKCHRLLGKGRLWDDDPTDTEAFEEEKRKAVKGFQQSILYLHSLFSNESDGQRDWHGLHIPCSDYLYLHT
jgi:hypothetical protein